LACGSIREETYRIPIFSGGAQRDEDAAAFEKGRRKSSLYS
jgi:hypothetical protein